MMKRLVIGITSPISVVLIKGQLQDFADRGYRVYLMAPNHPDVIQLCRNEHAEHLSVNFKREISIFRDLLTLARVVYLFLKIRPDIVNAGTPKASLLGMIAGKCLGVRKRIYTCRGFRFEHEKGIKRSILIAMERLTGRLATSIICISPSIKSLAVSSGVFREEKCVVIGKGSSNGIDLSSFRPEVIDPDETAKLKHACGIDNRFVFGFVGRLIDRKGINELIMAFNELKVKHPNISLLIVGHAEMDQLSDHRVIEAIRHDPTIISVGWRQDVASFLSLMDVFVLPAWWEGFGNVLIQAAAMGVPVISTTATGTQDAVHDGFNGILVPPRNVQSLLASMERYYDDSELRRLHGQNGREWANQFDSKTIWDGIEVVYTEEENL